jgi:hypothetical protein
MTNEDYRQTLLSIAHQLTLLATGEDGTSLPLDHPPGTTKVQPDGVLGAGKVRYWPEGLLSVPPSGVPELFWSYCLRMTYTARPDGEMYLPPIFRQQLGQWFQGGGPGPAQMQLYGAHADRWCYPEDWMSEAEITAKLASDELWAADYRKRYGV